MLGGKQRADLLDQTFLLLSLAMTRYKDPPHSGVLSAVRVVKIMQLKGETAVLLHLSIKLYLIIDITSTNIQGRIN